MLKHVYAEDGGEYGFRVGTYLDDVGTGVDLSFYYANYHSKHLRAYHGSTKYVRR